MNAAARVIINLSLHDHVKPVLKQLHWLPIEQRITYKLCLSMHYIHIRLAPKYLSACSHNFCSQWQIPTEVYLVSGLRSAKNKIWWTWLRFFYSGPATSNTLPSDLHDITDTSTFRKRLKSVLFDRAYNWLLLVLLDVLYSGAVQILRWLIDRQSVLCHCTVSFQPSVSALK